MCATRQLDCTSFAPVPPLLETGDGGKGDDNDDDDDGCNDGDDDAHSCT